MVKFTESVVHKKKKKFYPNLDYEIKLPKFNLKFKDYNKYSILTTKLSKLKKISAKKTINLRLHDINN